MKKILLSFFIVLMSVAVAQATTLTWDAPTKNVDGTPLTDLAGYKIFRGSKTGVYDQPVVNLTVANSNCTVSAPVSCSSNVAAPDGLWYLAVTAYDTAGNESTYSNEVSKTVITIPMNPGNAR